MSQPTPEPDGKLDPRVREALAKIGPYVPLFTDDEKRQLSELYDKTRYGLDAGSPVLWALDKVCQNYTDTIEYHRRHGLFTEYDEADYVDNLFEGWKKYQEEEGRGTERELVPPAMFYKLVAIAVRQRDYTFFEEVARLLRDKIEPREQDVIGQCVLSAYKQLKQPGEYPTKKEVREQATITWATRRLIFQMSRPWDGTMPSETAVRRQAEALPEQDWTKVFKRCGLAHLPNDKGGQPAHKKRPYSP